jgi:hypothetical protein
MDGFSLIGAAMMASVEAPVPFDVNLEAYLAVALGANVFPSNHIAQTSSLPSYSYFLVSEENKSTLAAAAGITSKVYQIDTWSLTPLDVASMELSLRNALNGFRGAMGSSYVSSCRIQNCFDMPYEPNVDGSDQGTYRRVSEYRFLVSESVPTF